MPAISRGLGRELTGFAAESHRESTRAAWAQIPHIQHPPIFVSRLLGWGTPTIGDLPENYRYLPSGNDSKFFG